MKNNFYELNPDSILNCLEQNGYQPTGEIQQLNSYENRVFSIGLEDAPTQLIAKFYRPGRWTTETLLNEHQFELELKGEGLAVAAPYILKNASTVGDMNGIYYALFEKVRGRMMQELLPHHFKQIGRWLAQLHNIGERGEAPSRPYLGPSNDHKWDLLDQLYDHVSPEVRHDYFNHAEKIFTRLDERLESSKFLRIHGDLHRGNILESPTDGFVVVDFDDFVNGPAMQDIWMLMPDSDFSASVEFKNLLEGYEELRHFAMQEIDLVPLLRGYRIITYAGWILNRWTDPSFPKIFPQFNSYSYWAEETESLARIAHAIG